MAFALTEIVGLAAAIWPQEWLSLFGNNPQMIATGTAYLQIVGPTYGFFGLGLSLYFASQGAGRLFWPLLSGFLRLLIAVGGGWLVFYIWHSLGAVFVALAAGLVVYGVTTVVAIRAGVWFSGERR